MSSIAGSRSEVDAQGVARHVPGEPGVWVFILGDLCIFGILFGLFLHDRSLQPELFRSSQERLSEFVGGLNTLVLISSSWAVAVGVEAIREGARERATRMFSVGLLGGAVFLALKIYEYVEKARQGIVIDSNDFFTHYFVLTGIHGLHVVIGTGVLAWMVSQARREIGPIGDPALYEAGASYWHMVDLLWIALFTLFYLAR